MNAKVYKHAKEYFDNTKQNKCFATEDGMLFSLSDKQHFDNHRNSSGKKGRLITAEETEDFLNPKEAETDINKMKVDELKALCTEKGIEIPERATKAQLIELLTPKAE